MDRADHRRPWMEKTEFRRLRTRVRMPARAGDRRNKSGRTGSDDDNRPEVGVQELFSKVDMMSSSFSLDNMYSKR